MTTEEALAIMREQRERQEALRRQFEDGYL